ncbi:Bug family tripartite tricarboxylate transporter substrate binding protein [Aquabacter spiritensis]|uniref:Tripartite-type tricarboxylate transporter receptor subunit TctC n=1 Tax=Aquabacter spiritensis TaxID=933073 RepID=A0A4V2UXK7_9HYPH|nr:tripartite tricarboxylate transporter substrate binding protein [Aquabacter spiritensis]TCT03858.1 tripartite-type tricarboxylate transporter receptor subunit TctC [Aquabacter spiritensis]
MNARTLIDRRTVLSGLGAAAICSPFPARADAGAWKPSGTVRLVVPFSAGGITDIIARLVAAHLQQTWGQTVVVDNKTGAGGIVGSLDVVRAAPDGLTLLLGSTGPQSVAYSLFRNLKYQPADLTPISNIITGSNIVMLNNSIPVNSVPDFIAWAKENSGRITYASAGVGSMTHLSTLWLFNLLGVQATHIPYRGSAPAVIDLMTGVVPMFADNISNGIEFVRAGKVKGVAVTSAGPNPYCDLPPLKGAVPALDKYVVDTFYGMFGPARMPPEIVGEINRCIKEFLGLASTERNLRIWAAVPAWAPPAQTLAAVDADIRKWKGVIEAEGLKLDY